MDLSKEPVRAVPKFREKRPNRKKKKLEQFKGVKIPPKRVRGNITKKEYQKALDYYGGGCAVTGNPNIEMHHCLFRSQGGSGQWRNLVPLCKELHEKCHREREYADYWRSHKEELFGEYYACDKYGLFKKGLIQNCTNEAFERFMLKEEEDARERMLQMQSDQTFNGFLEK